MICTLRTGEIFKIDRKQETITGNLLTVDEQKIEIDGYGPLKRAKVLPVYKTYGTIEQKDVSDIVIGNMNVTYVVAGDEVCAILLKSAGKPFQYPCPALRRRRNRLPGRRVDHL